VSKIDPKLIERDLGAIAIMKRVGTVLEAYQKKENEYETEVKRLNRKVRELERKLANRDSS